MYLYALTLQRGQGITNAIHGNFSGPKVQEIIVSRGKVLELLRPDETGKLQLIFSMEIFGVIRSMVPFRLMGQPKDFVIIGSDSGRIIILEYKPEKNQFEKLHQETFGKSGCRRIVPGEYLAVDPRGRACMIGAVEKQKLVYVLNRDNNSRLTISSPLEAHKAHTLVFSLIGLDCGFDNPSFAAIELDYAEADQDATGQAAAEAQKHLTFYELDLGLNHVVRKWSEPVDNGANMLVAVPGGNDGPGGVLVCAENFVIYKNQGHADVRAVVPRRVDLPPERGVLVVCAATHRQKGLYFFLLQTEYGDIFKVTLEHEGDEVRDLHIKYFDTIPTCAALCVLKSGFLFAAAEFGNHGFYQFQAIGDDPDIESSASELQETEAGFQPVYFTPRKLRNLLQVDDIESLMPIMDMKVANLFDEETPQIYALCGRGPRSTLRILRPGLAVTEMAVSGLPGVPNAVWTVKKSISDEFDSYIVVSFANATLVLSIGETVEEVSDSGFSATTPSLSASLLGDDSLLQVHPLGVRHIRSNGRINEWKTPTRRTVTRVGYNQQQVVIAVTGGELIYFELDQAGGQLQEVEKKEMAADISCLDIAPVPEGRLRSRFLAVGSYDNTIRVISLDAEDCMNILAVQAVSATPESLLLLEVESAVGREDGGAGTGGQRSVYLNAGLSNGVLLRTDVDMVTGQLADTRTRFLGLKPPKLFAMSVQGSPAMLCLSSRPWLGYMHQGHFQLTPLSYEALEYASSFSSDQCPEGVVSVAQEQLRVFTIDRLGEAFNARAAPLRYTPRKFVIHPEHGTLAIIESDIGALSAEEREQAKRVAVEERKEAEREAEKEKMEEDGAQANGEEEEGEEEELLEEQFGYPKATSGKWVSCIRVLDPRGDGETTCLLELEDNEAVLTMCLVEFKERAEVGVLLAVGTAKDLVWLPEKRCSGGFIHIYKFAEEGKLLELIHKTPLDGIPSALCAHKGRLLVGIGSVLRIYDMGKRKLLRKCENKSFPNTIVTLNSYGDRIYVGDIQESFMYVKYRADENQLYIFADDTAPHWLTAALHIDFDTMCGADKFGNVYFVRLPQDISQEIEDDPTGGRIKWDQGRANGAANKVEAIIQYHVGEVVTSLQKCALMAGGSDCVLYATVMGGIGALLPFVTREDVDFFSHLEMHMRQEFPPLLGRDHMTYRSSYFAVKDVIDGDLCEQYPMIPLEQRQRIAEELDRTPGEIIKKLEDIRSRIM